MEFRESVYRKTGGFMKGICWPTDDLSMLTGAGIGWVRWDVPYPFEADGSPTKGFIDYKARCRRFASAGIRTVAISPYPIEFFRRGMDVSTSAGLAAAEKVCEKMAEYLKDDVGCWQVSNELMNGFRAPLTIDRIVPFLAACTRGIRKGAPGVCIGQNSCPPWDEKSRANLFALNEAAGGYDYLGIDAYFGSWGPGGPKDYDNCINRCAEEGKAPIVLMEFGFASKGGFYTVEKWNAFLRQYGFENEDAIICEPERFIKEVLDPLAPPLAEQARRTAPAELADYLRGTNLHLLKCWPAEGDLPHTEEGQAQFFAELLPMLLANPNLAGAVLYDNQDSERCFACGSPDCPLETGWGLLRADGSPKPAYDAVKAAWGK